MAAKEIVNFIHDGEAQYPTAEEVEEWRNANAGNIMALMREFRNLFL